MATSELRTGIMVAAFMFAHAASAQQTVEIDDIVGLPLVAGSRGAIEAAGSTQGVIDPLNETGFEVSGPVSATPEQIEAFLQANREFAVGSEASGLQIGDRNQALTAIVQSPGTAMSQVQLGDDNISAIVAGGGALNQVAVAQNGSGLTSAILLVNSVGTRVVHNQDGGSSPYGGVIIINGVPGMAVILP